MISKKALNNLFKVEEPPIRRVFIVNKLSTGNYKTKDIHGRFYNARSEDDWAVGTSVIIQQGLIIGKVNTITKAPAVYNV